MKKKIIVLALSVLLISGCGSKIPTLSNGDEAVVTLKDDLSISANDLYEALKNDYSLQVLVNLIDQRILEKEYADHIDEAKEYVETTANQIEQYFGDSLETQLVQAGFPSLDAYKQYIYVSYLQQIAIEDYCKGKIAEKDVKKYYENEVVGDIKISHILITPEVTDDMTDEEKEAAEKEAKEKVESIIAELKKTDKDKVADKFAELAKEHSMDDSNKDNGGSLGFVNKGTLSSYYDELVNEAYKLKDGEYSTKVITTQLGYHVVLRVETKEKASLEDVRDSILEDLAADYLKDNQMAQLDALRELRKKYDMEIVDSEIQEKYTVYIQNQITSIQNQINSANEEE